MGRSNTKELSLKEITLRKNIAAGRKEWDTYKFYKEMEQKLTPIMPLPGYLKSQVTSNLGLINKIIKERLTHADAIYPSNIMMDEVIDTEKFNISIRIVFKEPLKE